MLLKPIISTCPFVKWGLYSIGTINPPSSTGHTFILTTTNYFTKWSEVVPLKHATDESVITFFQETIFPRFGVPIQIVSDNGPTFISHIFVDLCSKYSMKHSLS